MTIYWLEQRESDVPLSDDWLSAEERARSNGMKVPKRRSEWRLGRWTAKLALASFYKHSQDFEALARIELRAAASGAPRAFVAGEESRIAISLSHSNGQALCVISAPGVGIGCDIERIEARSSQFIGDYFTEYEQQVLADGRNQELFANLFWSAKESALKALELGLRENTRSVNIRLDERVARVENGRSRWFGFTAEYRDGRMFQGVWRPEDSSVRTIVADRVVRLVELHPRVQNRGNDAGEAGSDEGVVGSPCDMLRHFPLTEKNRARITDSRS